MSKANDDVAPPSAELLYKQSMSLINEAIASCGIEGFEGAALNIPQVINGQGISGNTISQVPDKSFFKQADSLFGEQENLFSEPEDVPQEEHHAEGDQPEEAGLNSINDMFNAI